MNEARNEPKTASDDARESLADRWNFTRYEPHLVDPSRGHLESTFIKLNDASGKRALWVKLTLFSPTEKTSGGPPYQRGRTVAESWAVAFDRSAPPSEVGYRGELSLSGPVGPKHVGVKQSEPVESATLCHRAPVRLEFAGVRFERRADGRYRLFGSVAHGIARVSFDLTLRVRDDRPLVHFPWPELYETAFPKSKAVTPVLDARADGTVTVEVEGRPTRGWEVEDWPCMQGHNWGTRHADTYAWAHVNAWNEPEGADFVLEGFSAKVRLVGGVKTPLVTFLAARWQGSRFEPKGARDFLSMRGSVDELRRWTFDAKLAGARLRGRLVLTPEDTVGLYYPNPDGEMTYCLNSKLAHAEVELTLRNRPPLKLTSNAAALEIATHQARHGIRMYV